MISKMFEVYGTVSMHVFKSTCFPPEILHFCRHMYFYLKWLLYKDQSFFLFRRLIAVNILAK